MAYPPPTQSSTGTACPRRLLWPSPFQMIYIVSSFWSRLFQSWTREEGVERNSASGTETRRDASLSVNSVYFTHPSWNFCQWPVGVAQIILWKCLALGRTHYSKDVTFVRITDPEQSERVDRLFKNIDVWMHGVSWRCFCLLHPRPPAPPVPSTPAPFYWTPFLLWHFLKFLNLQFQSPTGLKNSK